MNKESRLCFKENPPDQVDWTFGSVPVGASFEVHDPHHRGPQYTKTSARDVEAKMNSRTSILAQAHPETPVKNVVPMSAADIRRRTEEILTTPAEYRPMHSALALVLERETLQQHEHARRALEDGGLPYGPTHNPSDTLREYVSWSQVPFGSFFTLSQKPQANDTVFLRETGQNGESVLPVCDFGHWIQGISSTRINGRSQSITEVLPPRLSPDTAKVTVLSAMKPEEFDRVLELRQKSSDARPVTPENAAYRAGLRTQIEAFWKSVEAAS